MAFAIDMSVIDDALNGFTIPPQPQILLQIKKQLDAQEPNINRIAALINLDIGIAGFTLKVVNSAFFGLSNKITSVEHACKFLGVSRVIKLVKSVLLRFTLSEGKEDAFTLKLWSSALLTANTASALAKHFKFNTDIQDDCYILGMFHNAGISLISQQINNYQSIMEQGLQQGLGVSEIEEQHFQTCHEVLGYLIAQSWGLTPDICNVIAYHHSPALILESDALKEQQLFALLKLAKHFSGESRQLFNLSLDPEWELYKSSILDILNIEVHQLPELAQMLHGKQLNTVYAI